MIAGIGTDFVAIARIRRLYDRSGERFLQRCFTPDEASYCQSRSDPATSLAGRFAAKEAIMKCLGTGWARGVGFRSIEVLRADSGAISVRLHGVALAVATQLGITTVHLSMSHDDGQALAFAVAERSPAG